MAPRSIGIVLQDFALGGTERIAVRLAGAWARQGIAVTLFCGSGEGPLRALLAREVEVVAAMPAIPRRTRLGGALGEAAARHFHAHPVEACFVPGNYHWPVVPALAALPRDVRPTIVAQVSAALAKPQRGQLRKMLFDRRMRRLLRGADGIATLSEVAREQAARIMGDGKPVRRIRLPALDDDPPPALPAAGSLILAAGRLVPEKGFATLIEALALLRVDRASLAVVGAGPDEARLKARVAALGLEWRVTFPGYQTDVRPWLAEARLFVLSSQFEGFPAVLVEALAAGRPVIATDCTPATAELLPDATVGRVVPIDDAGAMARAIDAMLATPPPDPTRLAALVEGHKLAPVARDYLALFADPIRARRP